MDQPVEFVNHFRERVMEVQLPNGLVLDDEETVRFLSQQWSQNILNWHTPFSCVLDCSHLRIAPGQVKTFQRFINHLRSFSMKKIIGFCESEAQRLELAGVELPFDLALGRDTALRAAGFRKRSSATAAEDADLRDVLQFEHHFDQRVMEVLCLRQVEFSSAAEVAVLRDKFENMVLQWHSPFVLLLDCTSCTFQPEAHAAFADFVGFARSFFCVGIVGFQPCGPRENYPFPTFRTRHRALEQCNALLDDSARAATTGARCRTGLSA